jgi:catechol 2,3-dioxygenase-like lactoylglutathione lyase family enzyme
MEIRWSHIALATRDIDASIDFYRTFCALAVLRDRRIEGGRTVWLGPPPTAGREPRFVLVLGPSEAPASSSSGSLEHLGFTCPSRDDVERMAARGRAAGVHVDGPHDAGPPVGYWVMLRDPDGNLVEFAHGQPLAGLE